MRVTGLILAGGGGARLGGVRKADLRLDNIALWRRVSGGLQDQCDSLIVSTGAHASRHFPLPSVPDARDGVAGPAAGLLAGARWCAEHAPDALMVSVSVDTPFFPLDFVARAVGMIGEAGCVVARFGARDFPVNALWRPDRLQAVLEAIPPAPRGPRVRDIQAELGAVALDYSLYETQNPFAGINTLADLLVMSERLQTK